MSIVIDVSRKIAINVVHACIHGSFLQVASVLAALPFPSNVDAYWLPFEEIPSWLVGST
jgi:hypothetical protein